MLVALSPVSLLDLIQTKSGIAAISAGLCKGAGGHNWDSIIILVCEIRLDSTKLLSPGLGAPMLPERLSPAAKSLQNISPSLLVLSPGSTRQRMKF